MVISVDGGKIAFAILLQKKEKYTIQKISHPVMKTSCIR